MAEMYYWEAIRRAYDEELANDPMVIAMGEDIGVADLRELFYRYRCWRVHGRAASDCGDYVD